MLRKEAAESFTTDALEFWKSPFGTATPKEIIKRADPRSTSFKDTTARLL